MPGPLSHIHVLDLSRIMAGPWTGQVLADLGADVIKVERPGVGDDTRTWGPPFLLDKEGNATDNSGYYLSVNRGKRSITVDLSVPEGQEIVRSLAARSDILLENYKLGTLAKLGLGYSDLSAINPRLIYASVSGFGQDGPRSNNVAYDFMIQAMCGLMSVTGEADGRPGGGPQKVGVPIIDIMTGMYTAVAVLAALARREQTGKGDFIDIAMLDVGVGFLANQAMNYLVSGKTPKRAGNKHANIQPQDVFPCRTGHIVVACGNDSQFVKFCAVIGREELAADERFLTNKARVANLDVLGPMIQEALAQRDASDWMAALEAAGVPAGPINMIPETLQDPQIQHRQMVRHIPHPAAGTVPQVVSPMRFQESELSFETAPPMLGQHTETILRELGLERVQIDALKARGAV